ncbi:MAG TPA: hypothetical protein PK644_03490, partial [bacterium]|nr:hypothetical protein [bacterium]
LASSGTQPAAVTIEKGKEPATKTVVLPVSGREATTAPPVAQEPLAVSVSEVLNQLRDTPNLMENFKVSPFITEEGRVEGFRVSQVPENSLPYQYGLRSGDIIRRVNGVLIDSLARAFAVYQQVLNSATKTVTVEVIRNNTPLLLSYHLR